MGWKLAQKGRNKAMTNSTNNISADIIINGQKLEEVISFKYLGATLCKEWHLLSRNSHQDCLSNGQTKQGKGWLGI